MNKSYCRPSVIIVGAGPVGLVAANLLGKYQVTTLLLEKELTICNYPRATCIDDETLRILQIIGFRQQEIKEMYEPLKIEYFSKFGYQYFKSNPNLKPLGYPVLSSFLQQDLEIALHDRLIQYKSVTLNFGCNFIKFYEKNDQLFVEYECLGKKNTVQTNYLLACDGGKSDVRRCTQLKLSRTLKPENWLSIDLVDSN